MTRAREKGENEFTRAAKREAMRSGADVGKILARMLEEANKAKDTTRQNKLIQALKYFENVTDKKGNAVRDLVRCSSSVLRQVQTQTAKTLSAVGEHRAD